MSQFSFPSGTGSNMKLLGQGQDFYFLATAAGEVGPSILKANLSQGISIVVIGREVREQNGDDVVIRDIDLQGSDFVALLTGRIPNDLLGRVSPQGGITGLLGDAFLGIPVDNGVGGGEKALEATRVIIDGLNYVFSFCEYSNPYSCTLYQYVAESS
jgi:hypothetical protein